MKQEAVYVYFVECQDGTIYTGITNNIKRRMLQHKGKLKGGARYTREHGYLRLLGYKKFRNRSEAMKKERWIKDHLNHRQKRELAKKWNTRSKLFKNAHRH